MPWLPIVILAVALIDLFAFALCRAAADGDRVMENAIREERHRTTGFDARDLEGGSLGREAPAVPLRDPAFDWPQSAPSEATGKILTFPDVWTRNGGAA